MGRFFEGIFFEGERMVWDGMGWDERYGFGLDDDDGDVTTLQSSSSLEKVTAYGDKVCVGPCPSSFALDCIGLYSTLLSHGNHSSLRDFIENLR